MKKIQNVKLIIECEVLLEDETTRINYHNEFNEHVTNEELAAHLLFAFLNPKIDALNDDDAIGGSWDNICEFKGKLINFQLKITD